MQFQRGRVKGAGDVSFKPTLEKNVSQTNLNSNDPQKLIRDVFRAGLSSPTTLILDGKALKIDKTAMSTLRKNIEAKEPDVYIEKITLKSCNLDDDFVNLLCGHINFLGNGDLTYLDLCDNNLSEAIQMKLIKSVLTEAKTVSTLLLEGNNDKISSSNCEKVTEMLEFNRVVTNLRANFASKNSEFDRCIQRNQKVHEYCNRIKQADGYPEMRRISIRDNEIVTSLVRVSQNSAFVTDIHVVGDVRFKHINNTILTNFADGLRTNLYLTKIVIKSVELDNNFLSSLSISIVSNFVLRHLDLSDNAFTSDGLLDFCQGLGQNESLTYVDMRHQHSQISTNVEATCMDALRNNHTVTELHIEFRKESAVHKELADLIARNKKESGGKGANTMPSTKKLMEHDKKLLESLSREAKRAEENFEHHKAEQEALKVTTEDDWNYLYKLSELAQQFKFDLKHSTGDDMGLSEGGGGGAKRDERSPPQRSESSDGKSKLMPFRQRAVPPRSKTGDVGLMGRGGGRGGGGGGGGTGAIEDILKARGVNFTPDGSFLTDEFIDSFLEDKPEEHSLIFNFSCQFKMFKRFPVGDPARALIVTKFADVLLEHPRANEITHVDMSNCFLGNDWLVYFCEKCLDSGKESLPKLHLLNLETNFIAEPGIVALSRCISNSKTFPYLQALRLENQKFLLSSIAEFELAKSLCLNKSVIKLNLRVRNLLEREKIGKYMMRNIDFLRQARMKHAKDTGTLKERQRNKMEQYLDKIAANDPKIKEVSIVGDQLFLALNQEEKIKAAKCYANNTHVEKIKLSLLRLDDDFGVELGKSLEKNNTIQILNLDTNNFQGEGITAIIGALAKNKSIIELQIRHQAKPMSSTDEEKLPELLGDKNETLIKLGVDIRSMRVQRELELKVKKNQELKRKKRAADAAASHGGQSPQRQRNKMEKYIDSVTDNDSSITEVSLVGDQLFLALNATETIKAATMFANNSHITKIKMNNLRLDDKFGVELGKSLLNNITIEVLNLDSNNFSGEGIVAIIGSLSSAVIELQIRHQSKKMASTDEEEIPKLLADNDSLVKLGIDIRSMGAKSELDRKIRKNQDIRRKNRANGTKTPVKKAARAAAAPAAATPVKATPATPVAQTPTTETNGDNNKDNGDKNDVDEATRPNKVGFVDDSLNDTSKNDNKDKAPVAKRPSWRSRNSKSNLLGDSNHSTTSAASSSSKPSWSKPAGAATTSTSTAPNWKKPSSRTINTSSGGDDDNNSNSVANSTVKPSWGNKAAPGNNISSNTTITSKPSWSKPTGSISTNNSNTTTKPSWGNKRSTPGKPSWGKPAGAAANACSGEPSSTETKEPPRRSSLKKLSSSTAIEMESSPPAEDSATTGGEDVKANNDGGGNAAPAASLTKAPSARFRSSRNFGAGAAINKGDDAKTSTTSEDAKAKNDNGGGAPGGGLKRDPSAKFRSTRKFGAAAAAASNDLKPSTGNNGDNGAAKPAFKLRSTGNADAVLKGVDIKGKNSYGGTSNAKMPSRLPGVKLKSTGNADAVNKGVDIKTNKNTNNTASMPAVKLKSATPGKASSSVNKGGEDSKADTKVKFSEPEPSNDSKPSMDGAGGSNRSINVGSGSKRNLLGKTGSGRNFNGKVDSKRKLIAKGDSKTSLTSKGNSARNIKNTGDSGDGADTTSTGAAATDAGSGTKSTVTGRWGKPAAEATNNVSSRWGKPTGGSASQRWGKPSGSSATPSTASSKPSWGKPNGSAGATASTNASKPTWKKPAGSSQPSWAKPSGSKPSWAK